jgi:hypothetical protein
VQRQVQALQQVQVRLLRLLKQQPQAMYQHLNTSIGMSVGYIGTQIMLYLDLILIPKCTILW